NATNFNKDIGSWNVGQVTDMGGMFSDAAAFDQVLDWNTSQVNWMDGMFSGASVFDQDLSDWDLTSLIYAENMFDNSGMGCENYSFTLRGWANDSNTPNDIALGATGMEYSPDIAGDRNYLIDDLGWTINGDNEGSCAMPINPTGEPFVTRWNTSNNSTPGDNSLTIPLSGMYDYEIEEPGSGGYTDSGSGADELYITMPFPGEYIVKLYPKGPDPLHRSEVNNGGEKEKLLEISQWGDVEWSSFENAFYGASQLEITATDIPDLDNVTSMRQAFAETGIGNVPNMGDWNVSHVVNMREMFKGAQAFDEAIGDWGDDMQNVTNIRDMFFNATAF